MRFRHRIKHDNHEKPKTTTATVVVIITMVKSSLYHYYGLTGRKKRTPTPFGRVYILLSQYYTDVKLIRVFRVCDSHRI